MNHAKSILVFFILSVVGRGDAVSTNGSAVTIPSSVSTASTARGRAQKFYGDLPLSFEVNQGQTDPRVKFLSRGNGYGLFLTSDEAVLTLRKAVGSPEGQAVLRMKLLGANAAPQVSGLEELPGKSNYFIGSDPQRWRTNIQNFRKIKYSRIYPGIDLVYYGSQGQLEYDFVVSPGASPRTVKLSFSGAQDVRINERGELVFRIAGGEIRQRPPIVYQKLAGIRKDIEARWVIKRKDQVGFEVARYDRSSPLVIDPVLAYSTYLGGLGGDFGGDIAVDAAGNAYITGITSSSDFPVMPGAFQPLFGGFNDVFVTKLNSSGSALIYSTFLGGIGDDHGYGLVLDSSGNAYVTGRTNSSEFPITPGAFQSSLAVPFECDLFVTKLNSTGSALIYSTYLGGSAYEHGSDLALDGAGNAHVTGPTDSSNFPVTPGAFQPASAGARDGFVTKLNSSGTSLLYSTYLGGGQMDEALSLVVDTGGSAYVIGLTSSGNFPTTPAAFQSANSGINDAFVTKLNSAGSALVYSTYLGGSSDDVGTDITVDAGANAYVTGYTASLNYPTTPGAFQTSHAGNYDLVVTKLNTAGSALVYSTYLGGAIEEFSPGIAVMAGHAYVAAHSYSSNYPVTSDAFQSVMKGFPDAVFTKLNSTGSALVYSTYLGGTLEDSPIDIALDNAGNAYLAGQTQSPDFPVTPGAFQPINRGFYDAFVTKFIIAGAPATLTLEPPVATNPVDTQHCVTATVRDSAGNPVPDVIVLFTVTGSVSTSGSDTTDQAGQATFCYFGPAFPGQDVITAYADVDEDDVQDLGEPTGSASKTWVLPVTTPLCEILMANGGKITAANGDRATFGGNAKSTEQSETQGQQEYQDHGPAQPLTMHSINVLAIVCEGTSQATIYGDANVDGSGPHKYRIRVRDVAEPGVGKDTYELLLSTGYTSGDKLLEGGNIQIHHK